ncbi:MAG: acyl-CoA thioesterase [Cyclobacteriaceae bacterium]|nr:acyl-CoA thioesterase [Cyclobacteriaceae bacterium]
MYTFETHLRVRYAETDQMGFVYYGNYSMYYEVARVEALRNLGFRYKDLEETGIVMPVLENKSKYIKPARYDDLLRIVLRIEKLPAMRMTFHYDIYNEQNELLHIGETTLVFLNTKTGKTVPTPQEVCSLLEKYF